LDVLTGDVIYYFSHGFNSAIIFATYSGNLASKIPVSGASVDSIGAVQGIAAMVAGGISIASGNVKEAGAAFFNGAVKTFNSLSIHSQTNGAVSSAASSGFVDALEIQLQAFMQIPAETNLTAWKTAHGMPYFQVSTVSSLSGYVQCHDASVDIPGDGSEQDVVNGYMNSGFYYE
jgi:hypothetical protein